MLVGCRLLLVGERNTLADVPSRRRPLALGVVSLHGNVRPSVPSVGSPDVGLFSTCDIGMMSSSFLSRRSESRTLSRFVIPVESPCGVPFVHSAQVPLSASRVSSLDRLWSWRFLWWVGGLASYFPQPLAFGKSSAVPSRLETQRLVASIPGRRVLIGTRAPSDTQSCLRTALGSRGLLSGSFVLDPGLL